MASVRVWPLSVRLLHLGLIAGVAAAWWTRHAADARHEWIGYAVLGVVTLRLLLGWAARGPVRFGHFVRGPALVWRYAGQVLRGRAPRYLGHNPLGGWMIVALLTLLLTIGLSGWLSTTDRYWGVACVANLHLWSAYALLVLIPLHIAGAIHASIAHRENLVAAMIHGRKRPAEHGDVGL